MISNNVCESCDKLNENMDNTIEPRSSFGVVLHDVSRLAKIVSVLAKYGFGAVLGRIGLGKHRASKDLLELKNRPEETAKKLREALNELGTTYIKFGQMLSTRSDLLPKVYIDELQKLQDCVEPMPFENVLKIVIASIGPIEEHFEYIDEEVLGSASIAQVHRAKTLDGRELVLKVQRPNLHPLVRADIDIIHLIARGLTRWFEEFDYFNLPKLVEEFEKSLLQELNFTNELQNIQYFESHFKDNPQLIFPTPDTELSRPNVLAMRYIKGRKITDLSPNTEESKTVAEALIKLAFDMIFNDGIFHADPHPGNLLVCDGHKIGILDFGLVGSFSPSQRALMTTIVISVFLSNPEMIARCLVQLGQPTRRVVLRDLEDEVRSLLQRYIKSTLAELDAEAFVYDFLHAGQKFGVRVPVEFSSAVRALIHIESIILRLYPEIDIPDTLATMAKRLIADKRSPRLLARASLQSALSNADLVQNLPSHIAQLMLDLSQDGFPVKLHDNTLAPLKGPLLDLGTKISVSLILAAFVLVSLHWQNPIWHSIVCVVAAIWLLSIIVSHYKNRPQPKRFSLLRWFKTRRRGS
ncbi:MAG: ABC1 kinase family protein [Bradymonadia bacterium]|jgi:ubiquinone biosynthesis protein